MYTREEKFLVIEAINKSIAYRLQNETRLSEIHVLRRAKKKIEALEPVEEDNRK